MKTTSVRLIMAGVSLILALSFCVAVAPSAWAKAKEKKASKTQVKKLQEMVSQKKKELAGTAWRLSLKSDGKALSKATEELIFAGGLISSENFSRKGFAPQNYTLTRQEDGVWVFEAVQNSEKEGMVFWRGEFSNDGTLSGMYSYVGPDGRAQDVYFQGEKIMKKQEAV
jgi:hypothetical protein